MANAIVKGKDLFYIGYKREGPSEYRTFKNNLSYVIGNHIIPNVVIDLSFLVDINSAELTTLSLVANKVSGKDKCFKIIAGKNLQKRLSGADRVLIKGTYGFYDSQNDFKKDIKNFLVSKD